MIATFHILGLYFIQILCITVNLQPDNTSLAFIKVGSVEEGRFAISQFHRKKIGYKRIHVTLRDEETPKSVTNIRYSKCPKISTLYYTSDIRSMWGYIVFAFPYICSYVHSFLFPSQGQSFCVKVYRTSYFEDPLMDFIHIWHDGRYRCKVFISTVPTPRGDLGVKVTDRIFIKKTKVSCV